MSGSATAVVRTALAGSGIDLVASCGIDAYDARAPEAYRSTVLMPGAHGVVVAGSAGPALWRGFREYMKASPDRWNQPDPYDAFVAQLLARADRALSGASVAFRRFDAAFRAPMPVHFVALGQLVGLGSPGPFALLIHPEHGPWWALRGAWLVDAQVDPPADARPPCVGCSAPCVGGWPDTTASVTHATAEVRGRCVVGQASHYDDDQVGYHYDRVATVERLRM
jgi:epoxyqueuosine reductase QueG